MARNRDLRIVNGNGEFVATKADVELVQMLANDKAPPTIALQTDSRPKTIESDIYKLRKKHGCRSVVGLVVLFFREGLIH